MTNRIEQQTTDLSRQNLYLLITSLFSRHYVIVNMSRKPQNRPPAQVRVAAGPRSSRRFRALLSRSITAGGGARRWHDNTLVKSLFAGLIIVLVAACDTMPTVTGKAPDAAQAGKQLYKLGPGDRVRVIVYGYDDLSGVFEVDNAGRISLPYLRGVDAGGLTVDALEQSITKRLVESFFFDPRVSIELQKTRPFCVLGEVTKPGCYDYAYRLNAATAIAIAGGYTYRARKNEFVVTQTDGNQYIGSHQAPIMPGDVIEVYERYF